MKPQKVILINISTKYSAIGRYTADIASSCSNSSIISLKLNNSISNNQFDGTIITGLGFPFASGWVVNSIFQKQIYRAGINSITSRDDNSYFLHYTSQGIVPLRTDFNDIVTIHDTFGTHKGEATMVESLVANMFLRKYKRIRNILTVSNVVKSDLEDLGFDSNIKVIYPCVSAGFFTIENKMALRKELNLPATSKLLLSVSSNLERKNLKILPGILKELGNDYKLIRVGPRIMDDEINFAGINQETLNKIYNSADVLVNTSLAEGFGYPNVEAFSIGLPVVCSDIEVFREIGGDAPIYVRNSKDSFVKGIKEAITNSKELGTRGKMLSKKFSRERFENEIKQYYELNL